MAKVFISYAREDESSARKVHASLVDAGLDAWLDKEALDPGVDWATEIKKRIQDCGAFLPLFSEGSIGKRGPLQKEWKLALEVADELPLDQKFIIPIRVEECKIPDRFRLFQWVDLFDRDGLQKLVRAVCSVVSPNEDVKGEPDLPSYTDLKPLVIGVDVGTTKIAAELFSFQDSNNPKSLASRRVQHDEIGDEVGILDRIANLIEELLKDADLPTEEIARIGIGLPGQVDFRSGLLRFAPGLELRNISVAPRLQQKLKTPVYVDNDVNCSTLAELHFGQGKIFKNIVCVFVGTGIGAGIVIDGKIYRGADFAAGEVGHVKIDSGENARRCTCGGYGCFEEYASARAIIRMAREKISEEQKSDSNSALRELNPDTVQPEDIVRLLKKNDPPSVHLARQVASYLAKGLASAANLLNPDAIILGGGIIEGFYAFDVFGGMFQDEFNANTLDVNRRIQILTSTLGAQAPTLGASTLTGH